MIRGKMMSKLLCISYPQPIYNNIIHHRQEKVNKIVIKFLKSFFCKNSNIFCLFHTFYATIGGEIFKKHLKTLRRR